VVFGVFVETFDKVIIEQKPTLTFNEKPLAIP